MKHCAAILLALLLTGCAARMERAVTLQATHDLVCPQDALTIEKVGFAEYRVTGCDKRVNYQVIGECYTQWNPCRAAPLAKVELLP
jgi:hypothetical protein